MSALIALACALVLAVPAQAQEQEQERTVPVIEISGTVDPATQRWLDSALDDAERDGAPLAIVRLDTPGGLDSAMRSMVKRIIDAPMPVVVHVAPDGARAASAGLFLLLAGDVAAMAPQTNTGSATPVQLGGGEQDEVLGRKVENDAAAYVRALAEGHGRNADLAERMVRDAHNVAAPAALERGLIDVIASDTDELLRRLDGFQVRGPKATTLETTGLRAERRDMPLHLEVLQILVNPTVASLLLLAGMIGVAIELFSPGAIVPGVAGAIALVLGLYATAQLPVTAAGIVLLVLALALMVAETQVPSGGILGGGGVAALAVGLLLLYDTDSPAFAVSVPATLGAGAVLGVLVLVAANKGLAARSRPLAGGEHELVGREAEVRTPLTPLGQVFVGGALWRARTANPDLAVEAGDKVEVRGIDGLTLTVDQPRNANEEGGET